MTEPTTEPLGIEQRKWLTEHPERADEDDVRRLIDDVERLTGERDRLQSAFDTQQGWLNECQAKLEEAKSWLEEIQDFNAPGFPKGAATFLKETKP